MRETDVVQHGQGIVDLPDFTGEMCIAVDDDFDAVFAAGLGNRQAIVLRLDAVKCVVVDLNGLVRFPAGFKNSLNIIRERTAA